MARNIPPVRLGAGELELLDVLWRIGPASIAESLAGLSRDQGYTTVQTRLERLVAKGVAKKSAGRPAKYSATIKPAAVTRDDLNVLVDKVTGGRVVPLIAHLVREHSLSEDDISEIRALILEAERRKEEPSC